MDNNENQAPDIPPKQEPLKDKVVEEKNTSSPFISRLTKLARIPMGSQEVVERKRNLLFNCMLDHHNNYAFFAGLGIGGILDSKRETVARRRRPFFGVILPIVGILITAAYNYTGPCKKLSEEYFAAQERVKQFELYNKRAKEENENEE